MLTRLPFSAVTWRYKRSIAGGKGSNVSMEAAQGCEKMQSRSVCKAQIALVCRNQESKLLSYTVA